MDWIEDIHSRIHQVKMVSKFTKLATIRLYQRWQLLHPLFKSYHFCQFVELNPTINFIVIFYKKKCVLPSSDTFLSTILWLLKSHTLQLPILVTLCCQKLPKLVTLSTAIAFKNCQKWNLSMQEVAKTG